jgi:hypothetical protein
MGGVPVGTRVGVGAVVGAVVGGAKVGCDVAAAEVGDCVGLDTGTGVDDGATFTQAAANNATTIGRNLMLPLLPSLTDSLSVAEITR